MGNLVPYDYEPERAISSLSKETESFENETSSNDATSKNENDQLERVGNKHWCKSGHFRREIQEIDSLCCTKVPAIIEDKFDKTISKYVLVCLYDTRGDPLENDKDLQNRFVNFGAYKQFIWGIFQNFYKGNRRVIPSCVVWSIRKVFQEVNGQ